MLANIIMFRKAAVQCKEGTTVVLSICLANWLTGCLMMTWYVVETEWLGRARSARTEGATGASLLRYFQNTQHSLSLSHTQQDQQHGTVLLLSREYQHSGGGDG